LRITLNLATRPYANIGPAIKRLRIAMAALAVICLLFFLGLHLFDRQADAARDLEHSLDGRLARVEAERAAASAMMRRPENARVLSQAETLNQLFDQKAFSWTLAMEAMETVLPAGVQVTSIEPQRRKDGHINVELRVLGPHDRSDDLVRNLEHSRRFLEPRIESESAESSTSANQQMGPVSATNRFEFELFADYNPPTLEERGTMRRVSSTNTSSRNVSSKTMATHPASHSPRPRVAPATPQQPGRGPYTAPVQLPPHPAVITPHPAPAANGGPQ